MLKLAEWQLKQLKEVKQKLKAAKWWLNCNSVERLELTKGAQEDKNRKSIADMKVILKKFKS